MSAFAGTWPLVRLILRRDRVIMPIWVLVLASLPISGTSATAALYKDEAALQGYVRDLGRSALLILFYGPEPPPTLGAVMNWRLATGILVMAVIGVLVVIRHTRVEEEAGRRELVRSAAVGRYADQTAALVATSGASLAVGVLVALGMISQDTPVTGSVAMGLEWASAGIVFAAVGAVLAQVTSGAGAARGIGLSAVAVSFLVRGLGDIAVQRGTGPAWLAWVPPLGWSYQIRAYDENRWWLLLLLAALTVALAALAFALADRRDLGAGLLPARLGPPVGAAYLRTPLALAWRLHRGSLLGWAAGFAAYGLLVGAVAQTGADLVEGNQQLLDYIQRLGGRASAADVFLSALLGIGGLVAAGYSISAALRMRAEESSQRVEQVLATPVTRVGWVGSHLAFALLGPAVAVVTAGLTAGLLYGLDAGDVGGQVPRVVAGALVQLPAVWVLAGLTTAAYGALPRLAAGVGWAALAVCVLIGQVGVVVGLGQWALDVSPFTHVPHVPGGSVPATPLVVLTLVAVGLLAVGVLAFRERDVPAS